jgi:hypothetical protein
MKGYKIILFLIFLYTGKLFAQNEPLYKETFVSYKSFVLREYGISCDIPEKFIDLNKFLELWVIRENSHAGMFYGPILQTKDKKCIIMYPALPIYRSKRDVEIGKITAMINKRLNNDTSTVKPKGRKKRFPRSQIEFELKTAIGGFDYFGNPLNDTTSFDFNDHVTIIAGKKAREMFNADSIFLYNIPLESAYQKIYSHCMGMILSKQDRAIMLFKWFFNPQGWKNKNLYINMLSKHIWYIEDFIHEEE